jgi:hydrogenase expression/formation protein HypE
MFGLDPLALACEGRFIAFVPKGYQEAALNALKAARCDAEIIGEVREGQAGEVRLKTGLGVERILDAPSGEALPRIC